MCCSKHGVWIRRAEIPASQIGVRRRSVGATYVRSAITLGATYPCASHRVGRSAVQGGSRHPIIPIFADRLTPSWAVVSVEQVHEGKREKLRGRSRGAVAVI